MNKFKYHISMIKRGISSMMKRNRTFMLLTIITESLTPFAPYLNIFMSARIINALIGEPRLNIIVPYVIITLVGNMVLALTISALNHIKNYHWGMVYMNQDMMFSEKTMSLDYEDIENSETLLLRERIRQETQMGYNEFYLYNRMGQFIRDSINIIFAVALTFSLFVNPNVSIMIKLGVLVLTFFVFCSSYYATKKRLVIQAQIFQDQARINALAFFYIDFPFNYNAGKDLRLYAQEDYLTYLTMELKQSFFESELKGQKKSLKYNLLSGISTDVLRIATYILVILACLSGGVSIGNMAMYVGSIVIFINSCTAIINHIQRLFENNLYLERYFSYLDMPSRMKHGTLPVEKRNDNEYEIEFRNVSFKYPNSDKWALRNVNLKFKIGQRMAVVGMNGSGKTTMIKLLCRLYDPTEGEITLNGFDIRKYDYDEYKSLFSVVFQDFKLFSYNIAQNVASEMEYDAEKVQSVLIKAGFGDRLAEMEKGIETSLYKDFAEDGIEISGGESQKIALARALYKNAPFIVLDEPTAALDPIAEFEIYTKFNEIIEDKTAVYISHRLSSCRFCNDIVVFHEGELVQRGNHDSLLENARGKYHEMWHAQAQYYE